jgi:hypothetical protein
MSRGVVRLDDSGIYRSEWLTCALGEKLWRRVRPLTPCVCKGVYLGSDLLEALRSMRHTAVDTPRTAAHTRPVAASRKVRNNDAKKESGTGNGTRYHKADRRSRPHQNPVPGKARSDTARLVVHGLLGSKQAENDSPIGKS